MMNNVRNAKREMQSRIAELEQENAALLSKVRTLEEDRERFQNELTLTGQEMLTARKQAREHICELTTLRAEVSVKEKASRERECSARKECASLSKLVEKLQSRVAHQAVENRVLRRQLSVRCEQKIEPPADSVSQNADPERQADKESQETGSNTMRKKYYLAEIQLEKIPHHQKDLVNQFADRFFSLSKSADRLYREVQERSKHLAEETTCTPLMEGSTDSVAKKSCSIPIERVPPKGILRPPREHVESEQDNKPFWLDDTPRRRRKKFSKVKFARK